MTHEQRLMDLEERIEKLEQFKFEHTPVTQIMREGFPTDYKTPPTCNCNPKMKHREGCSFYHLTSPRKSKYTDLLLNLPVSKDYLLLPGNKERSACVTHAAKIGVKVMMRTVDGGKVKIYRVD